MNTKTLAASFLAAAMALAPVSQAFAGPRNHGDVLIGPVPTQHHNDNGQRALEFGLGLGLGIILNEMSRDNRGGNNRHHGGNRGGYGGGQRGPDFHQQMAQCHSAKSQLQRGADRIYRDGRVTFQEHQRLERLQYNVGQACYGLRR